MNNFPDFREKKYNVILIYYESFEPKNIKKKFFTFDPETNKVLIRAETKENLYVDGWMPLNIVLARSSWPLGRTGVWPDETEFFEPVSETEILEINKNTVDWKDSYE